MLVIGDPELRFRVNVKPTNRDVAQENYGLIHDLSAMPPARAGRDAAAERNSRILQDEIRKPSRTVPAAWLTGYFHACPAAAALRPCRPRQQARPAVRAGVQDEEIPCRRSRPIVSRASARRCSGLPARRRRKPTPSQSAASTPIWPATTRTA